MTLKIGLSLARAQLDNMSYKSSERASSRQRCTAPEENELHHHPVDSNLSSHSNPTCARFDRARVSSNRLFMYKLKPLAKQGKRKERRASAPGLISFLISSCICYSTVAHNTRQINSLTITRAGEVRSEQPFFASVFYVSLESIVCDV